MLRTTPLLALVVAMISHAAAVAESSDTLVLKAGTFDPVSERLDTKGFEIEFPGYGIVQFKAGSRFSQSLIEELGADVVDLVPHRAFVVRWDAESRARIEKLDSVRYTGPFRAAYKFSPALLVKRIAETHYQLEVLGFRGVSLDRIENLVGKALPRTRVMWAEEVAGLAWVRILIPAEQTEAALGALAAIPGVAWIERYVPMQRENADSVGPIQGNGPSGGIPPTLTPIWDRDLIGTGQIVAIVDSGVDRNEPYFARLSDGSVVVEAYTNAVNVDPPEPGPVFPDRKVYGYFIQPGASAYDDDEECDEGQPSGFHGTHVAGSAVGDSGVTATPTEPNYDEGDGMAPNAQVLVVDIGNDQTGCLVAVTEATYEMIVRAGVFIASNSFGGSVVDEDGNVDPDLQTYLSSDFRADSVTRRFEDLLFVKSAGNDGSAGPITLSHPAYSKNGLAVAAMGHGDNPAAAVFSSLGPTFDGRVKPDIGAPGTAIVSAGGDDDDTVPPPSQVAETRTISGTSMATPTVSGGAALARQYFEDGFYPTGRRRGADAFTPSGPLLKAVLLNGTRLLFDTPRDDTGWGRIWLDNNLYFRGDPRDLRVLSASNASGMRTGDSIEFEMDVADDAEFRATLTWYDPPGSLLSGGPVLVNDLDLEVEGPGGLYLGNQVNRGRSIVGGSSDIVDTVEQVILPNPVAGRYTVRVKAAHVPGNGDLDSDRQGFALAVSKSQCDSGASGAPNVTVSATDDAVLVEFPTVNGAESYQVYRAPGSCSAAGGYDFIGSTDGSAFEDLTAQGGQEYAYRVRGTDGCGEGPASVCKSALSTAPCRLAPEFDQDSVTVARVGDGTCAVALSWNPGEARCPGSDLTYSVYRSTDPTFAAGSGNLVASGITATNFIDTATDSLTTYYYTVRAEDTTNGGGGPNLGNESAGQTRHPVTTFGNQNRPADFADDPDSASFVDLESPWQLTDRQSSTGSLSYHNAEDGGLYPPNTCARITTPMLELQDRSPSLSYDARFDLEANWDGVIVEISNDGGGTWLPLPPDDGYPSDLSMTQPNGGAPVNACGYPATTGAFNGTQTSFKTYTSDLAQFAGQDVMIRWSFTSDPGAEFEGFYLDNIRVTDASEPGECTVLEQEAAVSGPWFNVDQAGHGWLVERLAGISEDDPDRINAYWYVYRDGDPVWLIGGGDVVDGRAILDVLITDGADFPPDFLAEDVNLEPWGTLTFDFETEDTGTASWESLIEGFGSGQIAMQRLAPLSSDAAACRSGSYYNVDQAGHGFVAEVFDLGGAPSILMAWYVYLDGKQVWLLGQAPLADGRADIPMGRYSGADFPPDFDPDTVINDPWGTLSVEFTGPDSATLNWDSDLPEFPDGSLDVVRLTGIKGKACQ